MSISMPGRVPVPARLALGLAAALLAAACGSSASTSSTPPAAGSSLSGGSTSGAASGSGTMITTVSSSAGQFLTDGSGKAVYLWAKDSGGQSACDGTCAGAWPPVPATGTVTATGGAQASDLGMLTRSDGSKQVTYKGHPLYYYVGDSGPGMANGQGSSQFGAQWWLVSPSGGDVTASVSSFAPGSSGSGSAPATTPSAPATSAGGGWS
jgi:predicted lipoprotein with Yx(FWY)xxD motif